MKKLTDAEIDARIRRFHDVSCGYQIKADALADRLKVLRQHLKFCVRCQDACVELARLIQTTGGK